jgi:hypothetical protein
MTGGEIALALTNALTLGLPVFPVGRTKTPRCPNGFYDATSDPDQIRELWRRYRGPLIGVRTGAVSNVDVFDIDRKHPEAAGWWVVNRHRLPKTRTHRTRSGGLHLIYEHAPALRYSAGRPLLGLDVRADGGYVIWWPASGLPVLCDAPPTVWPAWLLAELIPPAPIRTASLPPTDLPRRSRHPRDALRQAADNVARAPVGCRNATLNGVAFGICHLVAAGVLDGQEVADTLAAAATAAGLGAREIEATLRSAFQAREIA